MMADLAVRFVRRPGPGGRAANLAAFGATAVVALLTTFLIAGSLGLLHRSDRIGWRGAETDPPVTGAAIGIVHQVPDMVSGDPVLRLDLAVTDPGRSAAMAPPPGLRRTPAPDEVFVSPALADRWKGAVGNQLTDRYGVTAPTGVISAAGLSSPDELVVVRGVEAKSLQGLEQAVVRSDWRAEAMDERMAFLLALVAFGLALVLFPLLSLVGQAAGVAAKRREHRLAALRLAGATRGQVLLLSAVEQAVLALFGAVAGLVGYSLLSPLIARIPLGGGRWYVQDLTVNWQVVGAVLLLVPVLSVLSALIGLGRVSITPLGVTRGQTRKATSALRLVLLVIAPIALAVIGTGGAALPIIIGVGVAGLSVRVVGPWLVQVIGRIMARAALGPVALLAGRRLDDDPKAAFRPVAALVLSGFVTGFLALFMPYGISGDGSDAALEVTAARGGRVAVVQTVEKRLAAAGLPAEVTTTGERTVRIVVPSADRERVRTVLYDVVPNDVPLTDAEEEAQDAEVYRDLRLGVALLLGLVFITGAASTAAGAVGTALDQSGPARALRRSGVPLRVIERSARLAAVVPVVGVGLPVVGFGALCGLALSGGKVLTEGSSGVFLLVGQVVVGLVLVTVAGAAGAPVLRQASAE